MFDFNHALRARSGFFRWLLAGLLALAGGAAQAQVIASNNWEDGSVQGWSPFGSVTLANSTAAAHGGAASLLTSNRTASYNGPARNVTGLLTPGATYQISVWVRLAVTTPQTAATKLSLSAKRTVNGSDNYESVAASAANGVSDGGWTQISGLYSFAGAAPSNLTLYVEAADATASYFIDDFSITQVSGPPGAPGNTNGLSSSFESGTPGGWTGRGAAQVSATSAYAHGGSYALLTTGRTAGWNGAAYDVSHVMFNGSSYDVSLWARLAPGEAATQLKISLQRDAGSVTTYHQVVGSTAVTANGWVKLSANYAVALPSSKLTLYVESSSATAAFLIDDVQISYVPPPSIEAHLPSLAESQSAYFKIGSIAYAAGIGGVQASLFTKHFNSLVSENDMKWSAIEPTAGNFSFGNADAQVSFARANGMTVRGHTLAWHEQVPAYVFQDANGQPLTPSPASRELVLQRLVSHITGVLGHFAPSATAFSAWDVVNEAVDPARPDCLRVSPWSTLTGTDFIDTAFHTARALLPESVKLYYNDYNTTDAPKLACIIRLVADMKARGVPIDGIGHQMHINLNYPGVAAVSHAISAIAAAFPGIDQQVTEMDISIGTAYTSYDQIPPALLAQQGYAYRNYLNVFRQFGGLVSSVTFWGQADNHSWLSSGTVVDAPMLFDQALKAKPAYWGIADPSQLPGLHLGGSIASKSGAQNARVWRLAIANSGAGTAYGAKIAGLKLRQTSGAACTPVVSTGFPVALGDIAAGATVSANVTIDFSGCPALATFSVDAPFNSSNGWNGDPAKGSPALSIARSNQFR